MPITHTDGQSYYSKDEVEGIVKERVKPLGEKLAAAEQASTAWEKKFGETAAKVASTEALQAQVAELTGKVATAEGGLKRYQAAAALGVTDPDTLWLLEQAHTRAMGGIEEAKRAEFGSWLSDVKKDPTLAPAGVRALLGAQGGQGGVAGAGAGAGGQGAGAAGAGAAGGGGQGGGTGQAQRPAWASAAAGQGTVTPGATPDFRSRVAAAKSIDDLAAIQAERKAARG